jgi:hypothetical protein
MLRKVGLRRTPMKRKSRKSDKYHTLLLCLGHNTGWALLSASKAAERMYLERVEGPADDAA